MRWYWEWLSLAPNQKMSKASSTAGPDVTLTLAVSL